MRTITIRGKGKSVKKPDLVIFDISLSITKEEFDDALDTINELIGNLKLSLKDIGFNEEDLKTVDFEVEQDYDYVEKGIFNKEYKNKFKGFEITHDLKLEFDLDNDKISEVINCLKKKKKKLDFEIAFSVKDKELMKKEVLTNAAKNAKDNAEILAEATSSQLGDLLKIEYDWIDPDFESETRFSRHVGVRSSFRINNFNPVDIELSDSVTFVWELI